MNEAIARCWDVVSAVEVSTPLQKHTKHLQREVTSLYSRITLSWKLMMYMCKKSQWAVRYVLEQPRLNVFCKAILHLLSLAPIQRNAWEKPLAKKLAGIIYEDLVRIGNLVDNQPLRSALEFLKRKNVKTALQPPVTGRTRTPIDRFYYIKHAVSIKDALASKIIEETSTEFPGRIPAFRSRQVLSSFEELPQTSPKKKSAVIIHASPSKATEKIEEKEMTAQDDGGEEYNEDDFDDVLFEDVENEEEKVSEEQVEEEEEEKKKKVEEVPASEHTSSVDDGLEKYRQRNRDIALLVKQLVVLKDRLANIENRANWLPHQTTDFNAVSLRVAELLDTLANCTVVNTVAITSSPEAAKGTQIIEVSSSKRA